MATIPLRARHYGQSEIGHINNIIQLYNINHTHLINRAFPMQDIVNYEVQPLKPLELRMQTR